MSEDDHELERLKLRKLKELMSRGHVTGEKLDKPLHVDEGEFDEIVRRYPLVVVDFWAEWCGPCRMIAPIIDELAREYAGRVVFVKVDVDRNRRLAMKYGIMSIPTLMIFKDGKPVDMIIGFQPKPAIKEIINQYL